MKWINSSYFNICLITHYLNIRYTIFNVCICWNVILIVTIIVSFFFITFLAITTVLNGTESLKVDCVDGNVTNSVDGDNADSCVDEVNGCNCVDGSKAGKDSAADGNAGNKVTGNNADGALSG